MEREKPLNLKSTQGIFIKILVLKCVFWMSCFLSFLKIYSSQFFTRGFAKFIILYITQFDFLTTHPFNFSTCLGANTIKQFKPLAGVKIKCPNC